MGGPGWDAVASLISTTCGMQVVPELDGCLAVEAICTHNLGIVVIISHGALAAKSSRLVEPCVGDGVVVSVDATGRLLIVVAAVTGAIAPVFCPTSSHDVLFIGACIVRGDVRQGVVQDGGGFAQPDEEAIIGKLATTAALVTCIVACALAIAALCGVGTVCGFVYVGGVYIMAC